MSLPTLPKVQKLREALHAKAKGAPAFRFYALYDKVYRGDVLWVAYRRCLLNGGAAGIDGQTFEDIERYGVTKWRGELAEELRTKTYRPSPVRRVYIPKPDGKQRPLGIPMVRAYGTPYQKPWGSIPRRFGCAEVRGLLFASASASQHTRRGSR
jgi:hypothetical protein